MIVSIDNIVPISAKRSWWERNEKQLGRDWPLLADDQTTNTILSYDDAAEDPSPPTPKGLAKELAKAKDPYVPMFAWLAKQPTKDRIAKIQYCDGASETAIAQILARIEKAGIRKLDLDLPETATGACLASIPSLEFLALRIWSVSKFDLKSLAKLPKLVGLHQFGPYSEKVVDLGPLAKLPLRQLSLHLREAKLATAPKTLSELMIRCDTLELPALALDKVGLTSKSASLAPLAKLTAANEVSLHLGNVGVKVDLAAAAKLPTRKLAVRIGYTKGDVSLKPLAKSAIKELALDGTSFSDLPALKQGNLEAFELRPYIGGEKVDGTRAALVKEIDAAAKARAKATSRAVR